jgi:hypothetical protein
MANPDPVPPPGDGKPTWLLPLQVAMGTLFMLGALFSGLSGSNLFVIVAFVVDAAIIVWLMQQPWAKNLSKRGE